jgi:hypothetical protein
LSGIGDHPAFGIAVLLAVGKFCFAEGMVGRRLVSQILGALIGAILGWLTLRKRGQVLAGK